jgi:hypothetical protein
LRDGAALDTLLGTTSVRKAIEGGEGVGAILQRDESTTTVFQGERARSLLY